MTADIRSYWQSLTPTQRGGGVALAIAAIAVLYLLMIFDLQQKRTTLSANVAALRSQHAAIEAQAREIENLRTRPVTGSPPPADLRAFVLAHTEATGLGRGLVRIESTDADRVNVVLGAVPFAAWLQWTTGLQQQKLRLESCRIEALSRPGLVSVTATVGRGARR